MKLKKIIIIFTTIINNNDRFKQLHVLLTFSQSVKILENSLAIV